MRGMNYTRASRKTDDRAPTNSYVSEALALQAAKRPPKTPPKVLGIAPTLPKVRRPKRRRRPQ